MEKSSHKICATEFKKNERNCNKNVDIQFSAHNPFLAAIQCR